MIQKVTILSLLLASCSSLRRIETVPSADARRYGSMIGMECPIDIKPAERFGQVRLGMSLDEVYRLSSTVKKIENSDDLIVGKYLVGFKDKKVVRVGAELSSLPNCVRFKNQKIQLEISGKSLLSLLAPCKLSSQKGLMSTYECQGVSLIDDRSWSLYISPYIIVGPSTTE